MRGWGPAVAFVAGATLAGTVGAAVATIPGPDGVIHACYTLTGGQLRVVDRASACKASEVSLPWNQRGPAGARGPTGATGARGPTGSTGPAGGRGPSSGYGLAGYDDYSVKLTTSGVTVASLQVPRGSYVVNASAAIANGAADTMTTVACHVTSPQGDVAVTITQVPARTGGSVALTAATTLTDAGTVALFCVTGTDDVGPAYAHYSQLTAVQVDSLVLAARR